MTQWHRVGLLSGESREEAQPLLAPLYYIEKALKPYADVAVHQNSNLAQGLDSVLKQNISVLMLADIGTLNGEAAEKVADFVKRGGLLVRFAGPRLEKAGDDLLPVALRTGGRSLGGALVLVVAAAAGGRSTKLSPFAGLTIPKDVTVNRQVLADPAELTPEVEIWARLKDGTPLVTSTKRGNGRLVLFHVTANSDWSNLPISGLFVEMLRRLSTMGSDRCRGTDGTKTEKADTTTAKTTNDASVLAPLKTLDGLGALMIAATDRRTAEVVRPSDDTPSFEHPPGYYGQSASPRALNVLTPKSVLVPFPDLPASVTRLTLRQRRKHSAEADLLALGSWLCSLSTSLPSCCCRLAASAASLRAVRGPRPLAQRVRPSLHSLSWLLLAPDARAQDLAAGLPRRIPQLDNFAPMPVTPSGPVIVTPPNLTAADKAAIAATAK